MNISDFIHETVFEENEKATYFFELVWQSFEEDGFVITDEDGHEIDAVFKAYALQNILGEFIYRMYDEINETDYSNVEEVLETLGFSMEETIAYCEANPEIFVEDDDELTLKNALDYMTEITADKMLELFSADDLFDYMFTASYDFEQNFTFAFEDVDEFQAFVDSNAEKLDEYKEEYPSLMSWIEAGMMV